MPRQIPPAELRPDSDEITVAVTFKWRRPWALDHCEAGALVGDLMRLLVGHYGDPEWDQLAGIVSVLSYDPCEEIVVGGHSPSPLAMFDR